jgi:hypothetical protein
MRANTLMGRSVISSEMPDDEFEPPAALEIVVPVELSREDPTRGSLFYRNEKEHSQYGFGEAIISRLSGERGGLPSLRSKRSLQCRPCRVAVYGNYVVLWRFIILLASTNMIGTGTPRDFAINAALYK